MIIQSDDVKGDSAIPHAITPRECILSVKIYWVKNPGIPGAFSLYLNPGNQSESLGKNWGYVESTDSRTGVMDERS